MGCKDEPKGLPIANAMKLGEKIRYLREVEGSLRGLNRAMSQQELVRAIEAETGSKLSQSYLSQIESGARPHLTNTTRQILAGFFKVHPGYLVDDPEGYSPELQSELRNVEDKLDLWLVSGAERFRRDPELKQALLTLARNEHSRECLLLLEAILETPGLMPRLTEVLRPKSREQGSGIQAEQSQRQGQRADRQKGRGKRKRERSDELGIVLSDLFSGGAGAERGFAAGRHGAFRRACAPAACGTCCRICRMARWHVARSESGGRGSANVPWWNAFSLMIFLCWFGAAGYLLTRYGSFVALVVLVLAAVCGLAGGAMVFLFLTRVLLPHERELTADETEVSAQWATSRRRFARAAPERLCMNNWARGDRLRRAPRTANRFKNRKRSSSSATKKELPMCGDGKSWRQC